MSREKYGHTTLLRQVKGVGPITSLAYVLTLEDPQRFSSSREVGPYLGLVPKQEDSGDRDRPHQLYQLLGEPVSVLLTAAAYVLMQELRLRAAGTACARAQVGMLRERLLKLGARVLVLARRIVVHLPASFPFPPVFRQVALALGAATG